MDSLTVPRRFNGPARSGNGGWVAGALAATLPYQSVGRAVTVTLRRPPPLSTPMPVTVTAAGAVLSSDGHTVAEAMYAESEPEPVAPVSLPVAAVAEAAYSGHRNHPFPTCFVCGTARRAGDGLRIFPGRVPEPDGAGRVAATWTPFESSVPIAWATLDCPGGWAGDIEDRPAVLGRITVQLRTVPRTSERYVVVGEAREVEGRKTHTAATLYDSAGDPAATAEHVWIAVDPAAFR